MLLQDLEALVVNEVRRIVLVVGQLLLFLAALCRGIVVGELMLLDKKSDTLLARLIFTYRLME